MTGGASKKGGRGLCATCAHPEQAIINAELAAGTSFRSLATRFGISRAALKSHKQNHLSRALIAVHATGGAGNVIEQLRDLVRRAWRWLETAEQSGNSQQGLTAVRELRETLQVIARATGEWERPAVAVNIVSSREWIELRGALVQLLAPFPEASKAVAEGLLRLQMVSSNGEQAG